MGPAAFAVPTVRPRATSGGIHVDVRSGLDEDGQGSGPGESAYRSLTFALDNHREEGAVFVLHAGQASDEVFPLILRDGQKLFCSADAVIKGEGGLAGPNTATIHAIGERVEIRGCAVRGVETVPGQPTTYCVILDGPESSFVDGDVQDCLNAVVMRHANQRVAHSRFHNNELSGVFVYPGSGAIEDNEFSGRGSHPVNSSDITCRRELSGGVRLHGNVNLDDTLLCLECRFCR